MHYLHRILVYLPDVVSTEKMEEKELLEAVRLYADTETECFYQNAFDWRETDSAGRWSDMYPQQVYLASSDVNWFMNELQQVMLSQRTEIDSCMEQLKSSVGNNLEDIVNGLWNRSSMYDAADGYSMMIPYYFYKVACHLHGNYQSDSYFYNTHDYTARLYNSDLDTIRQEPDKWALVMFDYHN